MKCKFCDSNEQLIWPANYKPGDRPISKETERPHVCRDKKKQMVGKSITALPVVVRYILIKIIAQGTFKAVGHLGNIFMARLARSVA